MALMNPKGAIGAEQNINPHCAWFNVDVVIPVILMVIVFAYRYRESNTKATLSPSGLTQIKLSLSCGPLPIIYH